MTGAKTPRVALVTGGSGRIGRSGVERLAADGMAVEVHYAANKAKADDAVVGVTAAGGTRSRIAVGGDVADEGDMTSTFDRVEQEFGRIDVVVNTAGIMLLSPLATFDLDDLDRMHRTKPSRQVRDDADTRARVPRQRNHGQCRRPPGRLPPNSSLRERTRPR
jgi:3-oxoacyl-[acyl-carrier protein] reductase